MVRVAIVGAAGYTGAELVRLVLAHPDMQLALVTSTADAGRKVSDLYPALASCDLTFAEPSVDAIAQAADLAFLAVPHTAAMALAPGLLEAGVSVVDLSADFRLEDAATYEQWYGVPHRATHLLAQAVYGLPELWRDRLPGSRLVACAGCYPTATLLAAAPAVRAGLVSSAHVVVDAKSGVSGAGRAPSATAHFVAANESVAAYKAVAHRHTPEIEQGLARCGLSRATVTFVPHLVPMSRGLLSTVYLRCEHGVTLERVQQVYEAAYAGEPFVTVHPAGRMPQTREVTGSNRAHIGLAFDGRVGMLVATCAIDNLGKGAASQAVQCANLVLGVPETRGLDVPAPVV
ncbi:N-acetyl-gamma-glutamyl-phosphate reductase [Coriobacteriia bacterium Es71-Z0120]|uniref:N-acetyl-gamma-glutamyl-phosphate reductase n=1 Tax=Parvivirga hydrogeniphila TaxID=2939460 RepID=UPI002260C817|nr:N-acetyl-gamma-glutamyl-phosphate reductase [Parvivirga hydrogeniphila]MCL4079251.1 N-acetyl-gamma-glutamyl-phosphate reductase [Parvivirga hydrogeniphila]